MAVENLDAIARPIAEGTWDVLKHVAVEDREKEGYVCVTTTSSRMYKAARVRILEALDTYDKHRKPPRELVAIKAHPEIPAGRAAREIIASCARLPTHSWDLIGIPIADLDTDQAADRLGAMEACRLYFKRALKNRLGPVWLHLTRDEQAARWTR